MPWPMDRLGIGSKVRSSKGFPVAIGHGKGDSFLLLDEDIGVKPSLKESFTLDSTVPPLVSEGLCCSKFSHKLSSHTSSHLTLTLLPRLSALGWIQSVLRYAVHTLQDPLYRY